MREIINVTSMYRANTRTTTVQITVGEKTLVGTYVPPCITYTGKARWNKKCDDFNPAEGFRVAYERALAQIPKENIIKKCGGLKDGDWVHTQSKSGNYTSWGIVYQGNILYIIGSGNWDRVSEYSNGETDFDYIDTIVRPVGSNPVTFDIIKHGLYTEKYVQGCCKVYTAD